MTAMSKKEQGEVTKSKVEKHLGVRLQEPSRIAEKLGVTKSTAIRHLKRLVGEGKARFQREGRVICYARAS